MITRAENKEAYHHGNLREALLDAGVELIAKEGLDGFSLRAVAREANVSHAAPYRHFEGKEDLIASIAETGFSKLAHEMQKVTRKHQDNPGEMLMESGRAYIQFGLNHRNHLRIMFGDIGDELPEFDHLREAAEQAFGGFVEIIALCQEHGIVKQGSPAQIAMSAWSMVHGITILLMEKKLPPSLLQNTSDTQLIEQSMRDLFTGLQPRDL
ncbi:MAG: TetR family transcriptional regulator [Candidatus Marinimicrobia bacterium]|nr:TetR family transcriptional regulator [Candidatus Neomarinimicrobiota bacterium]